MSKPKKLFVVRGSEDGTLGVFSNIKNALARAEKYLNQGGKVGDTSASIEEFYLNQ